MKQFIFINICCLSITSLFAQRDMTPNKRSKAFGARDFRELRNYGFQFSLGPTYLLTKSKNETFRQTDTTTLRPYDYTFDPKGLIGVFGEFGMAHFPIEPKLKIAGKRIISYLDWGVGFKLLRGYEKTTITNYFANGDYMNGTIGEGKFYNGYAYGRITLHRNFHFGKTFFLDNGLGLNVDYKVIGDKYQNYQEARLVPTQKYQDNLMAQLHYDLGFGFKLKRGSYLIPGIQLPIMGFYEWNKGNPRLFWFSSQYRPMLIKVKYIWLLEKKKKKNGCSQGSEEDRKRNDQYMQGN